MNIDIHLTKDKDKILNIVYNLVETGVLIIKENHVYCDSRKCEQCALIDDCQEEIVLWAMAEFKNNHLHPELFI